MNRASDFMDPFNAQEAQELHHVTGRDSEGNYFDPQFVVALTVRQHNREHQSWAPAYRDTVPGDPDTLRLRRLANFLIRLGQQCAGDVVELRADFVVGIGLLLHRIAKEKEKVR